MCNTQFSTTSWYLLLLSCQVQKLCCARNSWQFMFGHNQSFGFLSLSMCPLYSAIDSIDRIFVCQPHSNEHFVIRSEDFEESDESDDDAQNKFYDEGAGCLGNIPQWSTILIQIVAFWCILNIFLLVTSLDDAFRAQSLDGGRDRAGGRRPKGHWGWLCNLSWQEKSDMAMDQYLYIPFFGGWTAINTSYFDVRQGFSRFWPTAICYHHRRHRQVARLRSLVNCNGVTITIGSAQLNSCS